MKTSRLAVIGKIALALVTVAMLIALFLPGVSYIHWVGHKDLEISFQTIDADTGEPIKDATVEILHQETCLCDEQPIAPFRLARDAGGVPGKTLRGCMCFGTEGGSGRSRKDTFSIHLPGWHFRVEAPGYADSEILYLDTLENQRQVSRGESTARLQVIVALQKTKGAENAAEKE